MSINGDALKALIDRELTALLDPRMAEHIRRLLVEPRIVLRNWAYGEPSEQYPCWAVLEDSESGTGIAYCEQGFGPRCPWGLVWLDGDGRQMSIGQDCGWFPTFLEACFESHAGAALPVWRVFRTDPSGMRQPITEEGSWDTTSALVEQRRNADPISYFDCDHGYRR